LNPTLQVHTLLDVAEQAPPSTDTPVATTLCAHNALLRDTDLGVIAVRISHPLATSSAHRAKLFEAIKQGYSKHQRILVVLPTITKHYM
jgi:hypothetical protein